MLTIHLYKKGLPALGALKFWRKGTKMRVLPGLEPFFQCPVGLKLVPD